MIFAVVGACSFPRPADVAGDAEIDAQFDAQFNDLCGNGIVDHSKGEQCESSGKDTQACNGNPLGTASCHWVQPR
jgi:hypothetical protein